MLLSAGRTYVRLERLALDRAAFYTARVCALEVGVQLGLTTFVRCVIAVPSEARETFLLGRR